MSNSTRIPPKRGRGMVKPRPPGTLKAAYAELVTAVGGIARAADLLGIQPSYVQRCTDPSYEVDELKPSHIRILERVAGQAIVTAFMATEAHCALIPLEVAGDEPLDIDFARYGQESAQLFAAYAEALADRKLTPREAGKMKQGLMRVMGALAAMLPDLDAAMGE